MLTTAKLSRLWKQAQYRALVREVCDGRPEARLELDSRCGGPTAAAALGLMRLVELNQSHLPLAAEFASRLLWTQNRDGSWGGAENEPTALVTALAVRALASKPGESRVTIGRIPGVGIDRPAPPTTTATAATPRSGRLSDSVAAWSTAVTRGNDFLIASQPTWGADPFTVGFVLLQVGRVPPFLERANVAALLAAEPRASRRSEPDAATRFAWRHVHLRVGPALITARATARRRAAMRQDDLPLLGNVA